MSDIEINGETLGRMAFEAYREAVGGLTFDGKPIPGWDDLHGDRAKVQAGWEAAADKVETIVRACIIIDKAMEGPFTRRERPSRWRPLAESLPVQVDEAEAVRAGLLDPADVATVERSRRVGVDAGPDEDGQVLG